jgi:hypothetical protein
MSIHRALLFNPKARFLGMFTMPFLLICEGIGPLIEVLGYGLMILGFAFGLIAWNGFFAFMAVALGLGISPSLILML